MDLSTLLAFSAISARPSIMVSFKKTNHICYGNENYFIARKRKLRAYSKALWGKNTHFPKLDMWAKAQCKSFTQTTKTPRKTRALARRALLWAGTLIIMSSSVRSPVMKLFPASGQEPFLAFAPQCEENKLFPTWSPVRKRGSEPFTFHLSQ